jgi:ABC-type polysaccharide/polyol phosphate export permease
MPNWYHLQFFYYLFSDLMFLLGLTWLTSAVVIFFKDLNQIVQVAVQVGFWGTPIFWKTEHLAPKLQWVFKLNPAYYITEGYRYTFIYKVPFWEHWLWGLYFWVATLFLLGSGAFVFKKLKPHFADVI